MSADDFRWRAFFQRSRDALFVLNRRARLLFVNRAWEALTGLSAAQARGLACTQRKPAVPGPIEEVLAHLLCPPTEVRDGKAGRARRLFPGEAAARRWWDVEFLPLHQKEGLLCVLGKIRPLPCEEVAPRPPLPEKLVALRVRTPGSLRNFCHMKRSVASPSGVVDQPCGRRR